MIFLAKILFTEMKNQSFPIQVLMLISQKQNNHTLDDDRNICQHLDDVSNKSSDLQDTFPRHNRFQM